MSLVDRSVVAVAGGTIALQGLLSVGLRLLALFLLFLLLQGFDDTVDGGIAVLLAHLCQCLQRVLQMHGIGVRHQFVEHLRAARELFVVVALLVEQADGLAIAALGIVELLLLPVEVAELQQQHTLLNA